MINLSSLFKLVPLRHHLSLCLCLMDLLCWHFQVKKRTSNDNSYYDGSHVMQYGDLQLSLEHLFVYMGSNPANDNFTFVDDNSLRPSSKAVNQRDAELLHFWNKVCTAFVFTTSTPLYASIFVSRW